MRLLLLLVLALLATSCVQRISEAEYRQIVAECASNWFDTLYYRGREGASCYVHCDRFRGHDASYVFTPADPAAFPATPVSRRKEDWLRVWTRIDSAGIVHSWIGGDGNHFVLQEPATTTDARSPLEDLLPFTPDLHLPRPEPRQEPLPLGPDLDLRPFTPAP